MLTINAHRRLTAAVDGTHLVAMALLLVGPLGLAGIALSVSVGYSVAAVAGLLVLERWLGRLGPPGCYRPLGRICASSAVMGVVIAVVSNLSAAMAGPALYARVIAATVLGAAAYLGTAALLHTKQNPASRDRLQDS